MTDQTSPATALPVCAIRTRYRSESGMIGHYPWSYSDKLRGKREYIEDRYDLEELTPQAPAQATIDVLRADMERLTRERDELRIEVVAGDKVIDELYEEARGLRADAARLDWLETQRTGIYTDPQGWITTNGKLRESIDAARARAQGSPAAPTGEVERAELSGPHTVADCIAQLDVWNGYLEAAIDRQALEKLGRHQNDGPDAGGRDPMEQMP